MSSLHPTRARLLAALAAAALLAAPPLSAGPEGFILARGMKAAVYLAPDDLPEGTAPRGPFSVSDLGALEILVEGNIYDVAGKRRLLERDAPDLAAFARVRGGILGVRGNRLGIIRKGEFRETLRLPTEGMRIAAGDDPDGFYVYGGKDDPARRSIYRYRKGGTCERVVEADGPVTALCASRGRILFSVGPRLYTLKGKEAPTLVYCMPGETPIASVAYDADRRTAYFCAGDAVYALLGPTAVLAAGRLSGQILWQDGLLWVADRGRREVVLLSAIQDAVAPGGEEGAGPRPSQPGFKE